MKGEAVTILRDDKTKRTYFHYEKLYESRSKLENQNVNQKLNPLKMDHIIDLNEQINTINQSFGTEIEQVEAGNWNTLIPAFNVIQGIIEDVIGEDAKRDLLNEFALGLSISFENAIGRLLVFIDNVNIKNFTELLTFEEEIYNTRHITHWNHMKPLGNLIHRIAIIDVHGDIHFEVLNNNGDVLDEYDTKINKLPISFVNNLISHFKKQEPC